MNRTKLQGPWKDMYSLFAINESLPVNGLNATQETYNFRLKEYLLENQIAKKHVTKEHLSEYCPNLMEEAEKEEMLGGDLERLDFYKIAETISCMDFTFGVHTHDRSNNQMPDPLIRIESVIPTDSISKNEIDYIVMFLNTNCFNGNKVAEHDEHWNSIIFTIFSAPFSKPVDRQQQEMLFSACCNHMLLRYRRHVLSSENKKLYINIPITRQIKDYFTLRRV